MSSVTNIAPAEVADIPESFPEHYTAEDRRNVVRILEWLARAQAIGADWSQARLAKAGGVNQGTANAVLRGKYPSSPSAWLELMTDAITRETDREAGQIRDLPHVHTSVHKHVVAVCKRTRRYRSIGVVDGRPGVGKTTALRWYQQQEPPVYYVRCADGMAETVLLDELVETTGAVPRTAKGRGRGTKAERLAAIRRQLTGMDALIILDEAERASDRCLEVVRYLSDEAQVGVVLAGKPVLRYLLAADDGRHGELSSRITAWRPSVNAITEADAHAIARAAFADYGVPAEEVTEDVLDACHEVAEGSARVLARTVLPGVRDYGLSKKAPLSRRLVLQVAQELRSLRPKSARG